MSAPGRPATVRSAGPRTSERASPTPRNRGTITSTSERTFGSHSPGNCSRVGPDAATRAGCLGAVVGPWHTARRAAVFLAPAFAGAPGAATFAGPGPPADPLHTKRPHGPTVSHGSSRGAALPGAPGVRPLPAGQLQTDQMGETLSARRTSTARPKSLPYVAQNRSNNSGRGTPIRSPGKCRGSRSAAHRSEVAADQADGGDSFGARH